MKNNVYRIADPPPSTTEETPPMVPWYARVWEKIKDGLRWWFMEPPGSGLAGWYRVRGILTLLALVSIVSVWAVVLLVDRSEPCEQTVNATIQGTTPDGTPATISTAWCAKWKPGREPKR